MFGHNALKMKMSESVASVLPIMLIVFLLCLFVIPIGSGLMLSFLLGAAMIVFGMGLFTLGSELSMTEMGTHIGSKLTLTRKLILILVMSLLLGFVITIAEPDLQVLANNVPGIQKAVLIVTVSVGVGIFLTVSMLRILFAISLRWLLLGFYALMFILAALSDPDFLSIAFDSGGVTTGPITVPFIMAFGVGVASIRSDANAKTDSFGLVALCSIGPILAVLILGFIYKDSISESTLEVLCEYTDTRELGRGYLSAVPHYLYEVFIALLPILVVFFAFQFVTLKLSARPMKRILTGLIFTFAGLVLFLTGVNVGFSPLGSVLGGAIIDSGFRFLLIPLAMLMGWFIINAEPAVHVLNRQVSELSAGAISEKAMSLSLSIAIAAAMGLAMVRSLTGISILWFLVPGYVIALALSFVVPPTFTAIAFDSGGVASGPLTATFMLPFAMGTCSSVNGNVMTDAFGLVALVAMMPLITVQIMGAISMIKSHREDTSSSNTGFADAEVIELWEVD